ncbi:MAG: UDP-N-acetylglucosamine 2-epimerase (non-hydrolyzing) [Flavobacteriales bacterium]|nr:UDP-N-acetylglucosamine 2-epimerase (non-hydrolyzing) [Flavobacteriales bacterium]
MKKIITVIGARPQIIKAAALSRAIQEKWNSQLEEVLVHTGQHYDENLSAVFFDEMNIPRPKHQLEVGSGLHGAQTAKMMSDLEAVVLQEKPDAVVVYGDTNSTLAAALVAAKLHIPLIHIEAGLRSFNKSMPEEINRILCDHCSTLLFSPTKSGIDNLENEGFKKGNVGPYSADNPLIVHCGDVMLDNALYFAQKAQETKSLPAEISGDFALATVHRPYNTDDPQRLKAVMQALIDIYTKHKMQVVLPLHPRTKHLLEQHLPEFFASMKTNPALVLCEPLGYLDMILLESQAKLIVTDSGGVQKEAYFFKTPCIVLRTETEWTELIESGAAKLSFDLDKIHQHIDTLLSNPPQEWPAFYGDGKAAEFIADKLLQTL